MAFSEYNADWRDETTSPPLQIFHVVTGLRVDYISRRRRDGPLDNCHSSRIEICMIKSPYQSTANIYRNPELSPWTLLELEFVKIKNYLSFDSRGFDLNLSNINVFTGPNASGKTNLLRTLWYVGSRINAGYFAPPRKYEDSKQRRPSEEIEVGLSLDDSEAATLADYLILSPLGDNVNPAEGEVPGVAQQLSFRIAAAFPRKKLQGWFRKVSIVLKEGGFPVESPLVLLKIQISGKDLFINRNAFSRFPVGNPIGITRPFARLYHRCR